MSAMASKVTTWVDLRSVLTEDLRANGGDPKAKSLLTSFRLAQTAISLVRGARIPSILVSIAYRFWTEMMLGVELPLKTRVGPGLQVFHGIGLVVNEDVRIGRGVRLRNGVVIGKTSPGTVAPVLEDDVDVGAGAIIIGPVTIGRGAVIGAGSVVVKNVAPGVTVAGNPAVELPKKA